MKALTVCQPFAHLIVIGEKRVENRKWYTSYRGPLLIHAGKSREWLGFDSEETCPDMAFGAIVGSCVVEGCFRITELKKSNAYKERWPWIEEHEHTEGPYCWVLGEVKRFATPIPYRGERGLFDVPDGVVAEVIA